MNQVNFVKRIRYRRLHARAVQVLADMTWCCDGHRNGAYLVLQEQTEMFFRLAPNDAIGFKFCLDGVTYFLSAMENLAVLRHPAINVVCLGQA